MIWTLPDGTESELPILRITEEGEYTLRFFDHRNGCEKRDTFNFTPSLSIAIIQAESSLSVVAQGGVPPYTYLWSDGSTTQGVEDLISGTKYRVTVTDSFDCDAVEEFIYSGDSSSQLEAILISPNPSRGIVNIEFESGALTDLDLLVYSMSGQEVVSKEFINVQNEVQFDMEALTPGVYIFQLNINGKVMYHKVVLLK